MMPILFLLNLIGWKRAYEWLKPRPKVGDALTVALVSTAFVVAFVLFFHFHDASVVKQHDAGQDAETAIAARAADHAADNATAPLQSIFNDQRNQIEEATRNAQQANPEGAARPVGPVSQSYFDELRKAHASRSKR